jgi:Kef-type K+ transport system membrane component KefB
MIKGERKLFLPLVLFFLIFTCVGFLADAFLLRMSINAHVVLAANAILFLLAIVGLNMQIKSVKNTNPHAMVRGVMGSVVLKLFVLGTAAFLYLYSAGESKSVNALFVSMGLYILYTWMEVRIGMRLNPPKNGVN